MKYNYLSTETFIFLYIFVIRHIETNESLIYMGDCDKIHIIGCVSVPQCIIIFKTKYVLASYRTFRPLKARGYMFHT